MKSDMGTEKYHLVGTQAYVRPDDNKNANKSEVELMYSISPKLVDKVNTIMLFSFNVLETNFNLDLTGNKYLQRLTSTKAISFEISLKT